VGAAAAVPVTGMATIEGTITGPARTSPSISAVHSNTLDVGRERDLGSRARSRHLRRFSGHDLMICAAIGRIVQRQVHVPWGKASISTAAAAWSGCDSQAALAHGRRRSAGDRRRLRGQRHVSSSASRAFVRFESIDGRAAGGVCR
jgi:hypothetical protein